MRTTEKELMQWLDAVRSLGFEYDCSKPDGEYRLHVWLREGGAFQVNFAGTGAGVVAVLKALVLGYEAAKRNG
jgi:hypothetical protein